MRRSRPLWKRWNPAWASNKGNEITNRLKKAEMFSFSRLFLCIKNLLLFCGKAGELFLSARIIRSVSSVGCISRIGRIHGQIFRNGLVGRLRDGARNDVVADGNSGSGGNILIQPVGVAHSQTDTALRSLLAQKVVFVSRECVMAGSIARERMEQDVGSDVGTIVTPGRSVQLSLSRSRKVPVGVALFRPVEQRNTFTR